MTTDAFDLTGPLPSGLTLLQASAGTGKTFALAALCARYVAEQHLSASQLCVVTFTEAATSELRGRIRERLVQSAAHLAAGCPSTTDPVLRRLADLEGDRRDAARRALDLAVAEFDLATISTIHGFCARVIAASGSASADAPIGSDADQVAEIVNDLFIARFSGADQSPVKPKKLIEAVQLRLGLPDARMTRFDLPDPGPDAKATPRKAFEQSTQIDAVADLVDSVVAEVLRRRAMQRRRTFDSLITDAREVLTGASGPAAIAALRSRSRVVMIDEFQDTDKVQWDLFRRAFIDGPDPSITVLVGDPKQSIYRFRSAELSAYLAARSLAEATGSVFSLPTNWRSDAGLLDALDITFRGFTFGDAQIAFEPVLASPDHLEPALVATATATATATADITAPLQFRTLDPELSTDDARRCARGDLVREVVRLLRETSIIDNGTKRPLRASDIGVLVKSNADASAFAHALNEAGVPAASSSNDSVFTSPAAGQWNLLLRALERPSSPASARTAAATWFIGRTAAELASLTDDDLSTLLELLRDWAARLATGGLPALLAGVRTGGLAARVLATVSGERDLTDLEHIAELLAAATSGRPTSATALLAVVERFAAGEGDDDESVASDLVGRRIDRDDDTVTVLTVHKAKGLEYPIVLCPTLWTGPPNRRGPAHAELDGERSIDSNRLRESSTGMKQFLEVENADKLERRGEDRRMLYVALTRARHRLVVWWRQPSKNPVSALAELLAHAGRVDLDDPTTPDPLSVGPAQLDTLVARGSGAIAVAAAVPLQPGERPRAERPRPEHEHLAVAEFARDLADHWRIWSFTSISAASEAEVAASVAAATSAAALDAVDDIPLMGGVDEGHTTDSELPLAAVTTRLQRAPAGAAFGTLVHSVLEHIDFTAPELPSELADECAAALRHRPLPITGPELAVGLLDAIGAPLGGPLGSASLAALPTSDRLDELSFDLPLTPLVAAAIAEVMVEHLPVDDLLRPWFVTAAQGALPVELDGMLTGSIDLVARTPRSGDRAYWLADYKTNLLRSGDYSRAALAEAMAHSGYGLQATLYLVALHRYLRWRLGATYDPDTQLLGAVYLFLRGMTPTDTGAEPAGVFWWRPPTAAILTLDRLLAPGHTA